MKVISGTFKVILYKFITVKVVQYHNIIYQAIFDDLVCLLNNLMVKFVLVKSRLKASNNSIIILNKKSKAVKPHLKTVTIIALHSHDIIANNLSVLMSY
jgi:hypothetical protein